MRPRFLADEDLNAKIVSGLLRREPTLDFQTAKGARLLGLTDPQVLAIAAREGRILVSHDRSTMPVHFRRFIQEATSPGLLIVSQNLGIRAAIEQILIVWSTFDSSALLNQVVYVPF